MKASRMATEPLLSDPVGASGRLRPRSSPVRADAELVLGRYRLDRRLGSGAFATVWMARDQRLEREVAVKVLVRERVLGGRFEREARAAARLSHPGIVTLYEAAMDDDGAYLVSELVRGQTLQRLLEDGHLSDRDVIVLGIALCDALSHAHAHGVVHRDVKPSNVLIPHQPAAPAQVAKLTDFGVARVIGGDSLTRTGEVIGTAAYMAPEQAVGLPAGAPADLYSLALVCYEALTGVNPLPGGAQRPGPLGTHLPPLRRYRRDLPKELGRGIDLALRPKAGERGTLAELRGSLVSAVGQVRDDPGIVDAPRWGRPSRQRSEEEWESWTSEGQGHDRWSADAGTQVAERPERAGRLPLPSRVIAGLSAALLAGWLEARFVPDPLSPALSALVAGVAVVVLPRLGWLAVAGAISGVLALQGGYGTALIVALGMLVPVVLLPRDGLRWPWAAGAPALGFLGLAGAWPALAACVTGTWRRAALAFAGWVWLVLVGALAGRGLYTHLPHGIPAAAVWSTSLYETTHHVLVALLQPGVVAAGVVWAIAAAVLPALAAAWRGAAVGGRLIAAGVWSALTLFGTFTVLAVGGGGTGVSTGTAALGALLAAGVVVAVGPFPGGGFGARR